MLPRSTTYMQAFCFAQVTRYFGVMDWAACNALTSRRGVRRLRRRPQIWVTRPLAPPENVTQILNLISEHFLPDEGVKLSKCNISQDLYVSLSLVSWFRGIISFLRNCANCGLTCCRNVRI